MRSLNIACLLLILGEIAGEGSTNWVKGTFKNDCKHFSKDNISVDEKKAPNEENSVLIASYMQLFNRANTYFLYCYGPKKGSGKTNTIAVIRDINDNYKVTINNLPCSNRKSLTEKTYMFDYRGTYLKVKDLTYLVLGVRGSSAKDWCRFDIGLDYFHDVLDLKKHEGGIQVFQWSERGREIGKIVQRADSRDDAMVAEHTSLMKPTLVLNCYRDHTALLRTPDGRRIADLDLDCTSEEEFIQSFYVHTVTTTPSDGSGSVFNRKKEEVTGHLFRLGEAAKVQDLSWYTARSFSSQRERKAYRLYFFKGTHPQVNCYWKKVAVDKPNSCPSIPDGSLMLFQSDFQAMTEKYKLIPFAKYTNADDPRSMLTCFKSGSGQPLRYVSVVTDKWGEYLVAMNGLDCSSEEHLNQLFFARSTLEDDSTFSMIVGNRFSKDGEWCSYVFNKPFNGGTYSWERKWVYHTYVPSDGAIAWIEYYPPCGMIDGKVVAGDAPGRSIDIVARYLWPRRDEADSLLLHCHLYDTPRGQINVSKIKTLKGETIASIFDLYCKSHTNLRDTLNYFMLVEVIEDHKYLSVGIRDSNAWCRVDVCVDCEDKVVRRSLDIHPRGELIEWTKDAVEWSRVDVPVAPTENETPYVSNGETKFVLVCGAETGTYLRSASGTHVANPSWKTNPCLNAVDNMYIKLKLAIVVETAQGGRLFNSQECAEGCEVDTKSPKDKTWLYFLPRDFKSKSRDASLFDFYFQVKDNGNRRLPSAACSNVLSGSQLVPEDKDKTRGYREEPNEYRNGRNLELKIFCKQNFAGIKFKDEVILKLNGFGCVDKKQLVDKGFFVMRDADENASQLVVGVLEPSLPNGWCVYNTFSKPGGGVSSVIYYGFKPDPASLQWYEVAGKSCPVIKMEDITVVSGTSNIADGLGEEIHTYVGNIGNEYTFLHCFKRTDSDGVYTAVFKPQMSQDLAVKVRGLDCSSKKIQDLFYTFYFKRTEKTYMAFGIATHGLKGKIEATDWCRYDICLNCQDQEILVIIDSAPRNEKLRWSQAGINVESMPSYKEPSNGNGGSDDEGYLEKLFHSNHFHVKFLLRCYNQIHKYVTSITSPRGLHLGTLQDVNCNEFQLDNVYLHITRGHITEFSNDLKDVNEDPDRKLLCWYYSCKLPKDIKIQIFYFFERYDQSDHSENWVPVQIANNRYDVCPGTLLKREDILSTKTPQDKTHWISVAEYVSEGSPKFQLHCYMEKYRGVIKYYFEITDVNGRLVATITDHDCSPGDGDQPVDGIFLGVADEDGDGRDLVLVGDRDCWFSISRSSEGVVAVYREYTPKQGYAWKQVPLETCDLLKPGDIYKDETQITSEDQLINKYISNKATSEDGEFYILSCYKAGREHVAVLRGLDGAHKATVKGVDCSSNDVLHLKSYFSMQSVDGRLTMTLGTRHVVDDKTGPWCQYSACLECEPFQVVTTTSTPAVKIEWSEAGIKVNHCPTPNRFVFGQGFSLGTVVTALKASVASVTLECHISKGESFLLLKTRGLYIAIVPFKESCHMWPSKKYEKNLVREFYIHTNNGAKSIFKMDDSDFLQAAQSCWNTKTKQANFWFYYFRINDYKSIKYQKVVNRAFSCPCILEKSIKMNEATEGNVEVVNELWNGGNPMVKLTLFKRTIKQTNKRSDDETTSFVTISNLLNGFTLKIEDLKFLKGSTITDRNFYAEYDEDKFFMIGSRESNGDDWCWHIVYHGNDKIEKIYVIDDYEPKRSAAQWYKGDNEECEFVKRGDILLEENKKEIDGKTLKSVFVGVVDHRQKVGSNLIEDTFFIYMYSDKTCTESKGQEAKCCVLVTRDKKGRHLVTVRNYSCAPFHQATYMFRYSYSPDILVFGNLVYLGEVRNDNGKESIRICQYDICLNCQEKKIKLNTHILTASELDEVRHTELSYKISNAPSLKKQKPELKNNFKYKEIRRYISQRNPNFVIDCYIPMADNWERRVGVVRTYKGLILAEIDPAECGNLNFDVHLKYILSHKSDGAIQLHELDFAEPPSKGEDSCWFHGCEKSSDTDSWMLISNDLLHVGRSEKPLWDLVKSPKLQCPKKDTMDINSSEERIYLIASYKNKRGFIMDCYIRGTKTTSFYTVVITDTRGEFIASVRDIDCSTAEKLNDKIDVSEEDNAFGAELFLISITATDSCPYSSFTVCNNCEEEKDWMWYKKNLKVVSEWNKEPIQECYSLKLEDIILAENQQILDGYVNVKTYMNEDKDENNIFVLKCYQKSEPESVIAHIKTITGQHVAYVRNLNCTSEKLMSSQLSYMSAMTEGDSRYLVLGTRRTDMVKVSLPWCRYDICIRCGGDNDVTTNGASDPAELTTFNWSLSGVNAVPISSSKHDHKNVLVKHVNVKYPAFSMECYDEGDLLSGERRRVTVVRRGETGLLEVTGDRCLASINVSDLHVYTLYRESYTLVRPSGSTSEAEQRGGDEVEKIYCVFAQRENSPRRLWKQVTNPKVAPKSLKALGVSETVEEEKCLPPSNFVQPVVEDSAKKGAKKSKNPKERKGIMNWFGRRSTKKNQ